jgi:hypothetical protein
MYQDFIGVSKLLKPWAEYTVKTPPLFRPNLLKRHWDLLRIVVGEQSHHPQHRKRKHHFTFHLCDNVLVLLLVAKCWLLL